MIPNVKAEPVSVSVATKDSSDSKVWMAAGKHTSYGRIGWDIGERATKHEEKNPGNQDNGRNDGGLHWLSFTRDARKRLTTPSSATPVRCSAWLGVAVIW